MSKILIVVDMQNDFLTGSLANESAVKVIPNIIKEFESKEYSNIIFTRDTHCGENYLSTQEGKLLPLLHCVKNSKGWEICDELSSSVLSLGVPFSVVDKPTFGFNGWHDTILSDIVKEDTEIVFVGTCTDICVVSNALIIKALFPENKVTCISSCCAPLCGMADKQEAALSVMKSCQINVI